MSALTIDTGAEGIGASTPAVPRVGMLTECHGQQCRIIAVHYPGTLDVEAPSGKCFRISGLWFPKEGGIK